MDARWGAFICSRDARRLTLAVTALCLALTGAPAQADSPTLDHLIQKVATQEKVDPALLRAVVATESDFNTRTISPDGAVGLMQLMPETARIMGVKNIFNPEQNLRGGARYLNRMLKRFPNLHHALAAYNAGPGMVTRFQGIPPLAETQRYVGKVISHYKSKKPVPAKAKKPIDPKSAINGVVYLTDARDLIAKNARLLFNDSTVDQPALPAVSIRRANMRARQEIPSRLTADAARPTRSGQLALALSEELEGETIPILRAQ
ncbi:MAG: lytic transglycosylase domain-containing protein [Magnetococcales bacterium]|nr:lytic transglycosylase domain-containing protein [Magnetococcales bacterium]